MTPHEPALRESFDRVSFEYIPEHYTGDYPYMIIRIKKSQITDDMKYKISEKISPILAMLKEISNG